MWRRAVKLVASGDRRSRRIRWRDSRRCPARRMPGRTRRWPSTGETFQAALRPASAALHARMRRSTRCGARCRANGMLSFDVGAHTHQIAQPMDRARAQDLPHHQRLVVHGLRPAGRDRGQARAARPAGGLHARRRLLPDDLRRGRGREAARHHAADRRARRPLARADQGEADPPPVPALRHGVAAGRVPRAAEPLFRRAGGRRPQSPDALEAR